MGSKRVKARGALQSARTVSGKPTYCVMLSSCSGNFPRRYFLLFRQDPRKPRGHGGVRHASVSAFHFALLIFSCLQQQYAVRHNCVQLLSDALYPSGSAISAPQIRIALEVNLSGEATVQASAQK